MTSLYKRISNMRSFHLPGVVAILIAASSISMPSCSKIGQSARPIDKAAPIVFDSIKKAKIDSLAMRINNLVGTNQGKSKKIPYPVYNPTDSIGFLFTEEHHGRISMNTHPDSNIIWPYFWIYDGDLILMRLRMYNKGPERSASETVVYFDKGRIVYCNERKKVLQDKEIPGAVQNEPLVKSSRSYGELEQMSKKYWSEVLTEMKKQNVLPEWIKP